MKTTKIYTKTGDKGTTGLVDGKRVSKSDLRLEAYGTVDELNSVIGCARALKPPKETDELLENFQNELFSLGSHLACIDEKMAAKLPPLKNESILAMESAIDKMTSQLEPLKNFILPGGHPVAAQLHLARTVCRRAERCVVRLVEHLKESGEAAQTPSHNSQTLSQVIIYLNRMSDCLFTLARFVNHSEGVQSIVWKK